MSHNRCVCLASTVLQHLFQIFIQLSNHDQTQTVSFPVSRTSTSQCVICTDACILLKCHIKFILGFVYNMPLPLFRPNFWTLIGSYLPQGRCTEREYNEASRKALEAEWKIWDNEQGTVFGVATFKWDGQIEPTACETCWSTDDYVFRALYKYNHRSCRSCRAVIIYQIKNYLVLKFFGSH